MAHLAFPKSSLNSSTLKNTWNIVREAGKTYDKFQNIRGFVRRATLYLKNQIDGAFVITMNFISSSNNHSS